MNRNFPPLLALIISLSATIFYFMNDNKDTALNALFIGLYITISLYLLLRILFYFRYKATINEMFFVFFVNIIASILIFTGPYIPLSADPQFNILITLDQNNNLQLYITLISLLVFPYFVLSIILQVRSFTKYEFFRISPTSEKGFKAEWVAYFVYFVFGGIFVFVGLLSSDLLAVLVGLFYLFSGTSFLIAK